MTRLCFGMAFALGALALLVWAEEYYRNWRHRREAAKHAKGGA